MNEDNTQIEPEMPAGVPEGTVLHGSEGHEVIVHDLDADGNVIGWHKEVANG